MNQDNAGQILLPLPLEIFSRATDFAALQAAKTVGSGDKLWADYMATEAMRSIFNNELPGYGYVICTEGDLDKSFGLRYHECVGMGTPKMGQDWWRVVSEGGKLEDVVMYPDYDIAVDTLDGTTLCAKGLDGAVSVFAMAPRGSLLDVPEMYMWRIAVGPKAKGAISLNKTSAQNVLDVAGALGKHPSEMTVAILDRQGKDGQSDRHKELITEVRETGARIKLLPAGDVAPIVAICDDNYDGLDMYIGAGGAPEGVISAAIAYCMGGDFCGYLSKAITEKEMGEPLGFEVDESPMTLEQIVRGGVHTVCITAVTDTYGLPGVCYRNGKAVLSNVIMRGSTKTVERRTVEKYVDGHQWQKYINPQTETLAGFKRFLTEVK